MGEISVAERNALPVGVCSCGEENCRELGWPHEWNPALDDCVLCSGGQGPLDVATAVRTGSGYAHPDCADPPPEVVAEPLLWEGDDG